MVRVALLLLTGCTHTVAVSTRPVTATITRGGASWTSPTEVRCPWIGACRVTVTKDGYRPLSAVLRGKRVELILVPAHGPAGTWSPGDQGLGP